MSHQAVPDARIAADLLERAKGDPELFQRIMRMYEVCGSNVACLQAEMRDLHAKVFMAGAAGRRQAQEERFAEAVGVE